jgi:hypothetical protein
MAQSDFQVESIGVDTSNLAPPHTWYLRIRKKDWQKEEQKPDGAQ